MASERGGLWILDYTPETENIGVAKIASPLSYRK